MKRIFLIGYMGAGKTTLGKELARRMKLSFIDLDHYIEARYHKMVGQIFAEEGEEPFREYERKLLHEVGTFEDVVISTGGGAPCFFDNIRYMNEAGTTVYLKVSPGELSKRLTVSKQNRPVLKGKTGAELEAFIEENLRKRESFYGQAAIVFDAEVMLTENDVREISKSLAKIL